VGRTACTEPQCLYRASVPVQGCTLPFYTVPLILKFIECKSCTILKTKGQNFLKQRQAIFIYNWDALFLLRGRKLNTEISFSRFRLFEAVCSYVTFPYFSEIRVCLSFLWIRCCSGEFPTWVFSALLSVIPNLHRFRSVSFEHTSLCIASDKLEVMINCQ